MSAATGIYATSDWTNVLDLTTAALVGSVSATSYVLYGQIGLAQAGIIPLLRGKLAPSVRISPQDKVSLWSAFYNIAKKISLGGTAVALVSDAIVALNTNNRTVRNLSIASGLVGALIVPFTYAFIMPTNRELFALEAENKLAGVEPSSQEAQRADKLIENWETLHSVRFAMKAGGAILALAALVADRRSTYIASETVVL